MLATLALTALQDMSLREEAESLLRLLAKGGLVMIPIGVCSVIAVAVALERAIRLRRARVAPNDLAPELRLLLQNPEKPLESAIEYLDRRPGPLSSILRAGVLSLPLGPDAVQKAMEDAGAREAGWMKRSLRPLSAIAQLAPLLGLLGTIYGMITAFQAAASAGVGRGDQLAAGIYEALLTTAAGLTVAIPALIAHQVLTGRVDRLIDAMDEAVEGFLQEIRTRAHAREARRPGP
jgi:biopolymer transport protein ExbB